MTARWVCGGGVLINTNPFYAHNIHRWVVVCCAERGGWIGVVLLKERDQDTDQYRRFILRVFPQSGLNVPYFLRRRAFLL